LQRTQEHWYAQPIAGLYSCSAWTHRAGSVIGCAGHNAAMRVLKDLGLTDTDLIDV
jgi:phytoene dehydrogenase-like protein